MNSTDPSYYGTLLIGFLDFYSQFASTKKAISLTGGGSYLSSKDCTIPLETKTGKLTIVDPDMPGIWIKTMHFCDLND